MQGHAVAVLNSDNTTTESTQYSGGCYRRYEWCGHTRRVPLALYILSSTIIFGIAFPFNASPIGTIYSQVLGPRQQVSITSTDTLSTARGLQGTMQGLFALIGSLARFIAPLFST